jgi:tetratricopeptide (TPR) repeat protein
LDEGGEEARRKKAEAMLAKLGYPFDAGTAGAEALSQLDALQLSNLGMQIPISLPTSFLLDSRGLVSVVYKGPVTVEQLLADVRRLESEPAERRNDAAPFPGKWIGPPSGTEPIRLALKMADGGEREAGIAYLQRYLEKYREGILPESDPEAGLLETPLEEVYFAMARLHRQAGERPEAVAAYRKILELDSSHPKALLDLGHLFLRSGQPAMAAGYLDSLLAVSPDHLDALSLSATASLQLGKLAEAEELSRRILREEPEHATAHLNLGLAAEGREQFTEAVDHYRQALRILPGWDIALNQLAWILATSPDDLLVDGDEALALARQLNQASGGRQPVFLRTLAAAQAASGQFESALETITKALSLVPPTQRGLRQTFGKMRLRFQQDRPYRLEASPKK